jgi:hypothetical protein
MLQLTAIQLATELLHPQIAPSKIAPLQLNLCWRFFAPGQIHL